MTNAKDRPVIPIRAKAGYIEVQRKDKGGRVRSAKQHVVASEGMHTAKEMEQIMVGIAKEVGADESQIRIDTYKQGRSPLETNPRHRGFGHNYFRKSPGPVKTTQPPRERRLFTGGIPKTPEEWEAHVREFEERKARG